MARSHGVIKVEVWQAENDFRTLTVDAQWAFAMLVSQPQINNLGVLPYVPEKWGRLAADLNQDRLAAALDQLERHRFTITDPDTGELLVRTFIRHDKVWSQPKLVTNARRLIREVESVRVRTYLAGRHPWLVDDGWTAAKITAHETRKHPRKTPSESPSVTPSDTGSVSPPETPTGVEGVTEGLSPPRARAQDGLPQPQPQPQPVHELPTAAAEPPRQPAAEHPAAADGKPPAEADSWHVLANDLKAIGWAPWQTAKAERNPERAQAALNRATAEANDNPGGYAWTLFNNGGTITPPEPPTPKRKTPDELLAAAEDLRDLEAALDYLAGIPWLTTSQRDQLAAQLEQRLNTAATSEAA